MDCVKPGRAGTQDACAKSLHEDYVFFAENDVIGFALLMTLKKIPSQVRNVCECFGYMGAHKYVLYHDVNVYYFVYYIILLRYTIYTCFPFEFPFARRSEII